MSAATPISETVALSHIYRDLLEEFEAMADKRLAEPQRARMMEHISNAMNRSLTVMSARCGHCDSKLLVCGSCGRKSSS